MSQRRPAAGATPPLAVTMGEPAGVGAEITIKAWLRRERTLPPFFLIDDAGRLRRLIDRLGWPVTVRAIADAAEAKEIFPRALPVLDRPLAVEPVPGRPDAATAGAVIAAIETAVALVASATASGVVTNPIHKRVLYDAGFGFPGHTEFLASLTGVSTSPVMMLAGPRLRVVPVMVHVSLRRAIDALSTGAILHAATVTEAALRRDFGIARPRLAVAGLNPHAGEQGTLGNEEIEIIAPAIAELRQQGLQVNGPLSPDAMFSEQAREHYDAAVCMYHDQALIPLKALDFDHGVNVTLGLPLVRTSPDHGTAFDLAGRGQANETSMMEALRLAAAIAERRNAAFT